MVSCQEIVNENLISKEINDKGKEFWPERETSTSYSRDTKYKA